MKKNSFFLIVAIAMVSVLATSCGNNKKQTPAEPQYETVTVDSETNFEVKIPADKFNKDGTTYFVLKDVKGETVTFDNGVATIKAGGKTYKVYPQTGYEFGNVYAKAADKVKDAVYVGAKSGSNSKSFVLFADCSRTKKVSINQKTVVDSKQTVKPVVLDNIVPAKETKQVLKEPAPAKKK